jgi:exopolysaccharide biosynthesis polyprenyl glycosylphosphotransferase
MVFNNYFFGHTGLYDDRKPPSIPHLVLQIAKVMVISFSILSVIIFVAKLYDYPRAFFLIFACASFLLLILERGVLREYHYHVAHKAINSRKILIVGSMMRGQLVSDLLDKQLSWGHEVIGRLSVGKVSSSPSIGSIHDLHEVLRSQTVDEVVFAIEQTQPISLTPYLELCKKIGVSVRILPSLWEPGDKNLSVERCQGVPFIVMKAVSFNATGLLYKRVLDMVGGAVGTLLFLLIYPFVGLAIKLDSPGPIIFAQQRVGQNGRIFKLYKFRSMYQDAEERKKELLSRNEMGGVMFKIQHDPRITKVGRWLRATSIDEIPQFWNVLTGQMSLVGTRPPTLNEVAEYKDWHLRRLSLKPGLTGLWQVSGRNQIKDFNKIVELDCAYFDNWRFFKDIQIICKTIVVVLRRKGY